MSRIEFYKESFKAIDELKDILTTAAKKNNLSEGALIALLALNNGVDLSFAFKVEFIEELEKTGLVLVKDDRPSITGKGAILAKSLERIL